jgi:hypothetical protein
MKKLYSLLFFILFVFTGSVFAQEFRIAGSLINADDQQPLVGATVKLTSIRDPMFWKSLM